MSVEDAISNKILPRGKNKDSFSGVYFNRNSQH